MNKSFYSFVSCLLFSSNVLEGNNVFCNNQASSDMKCIAISHVMYKGLLEGYANQMIQYKEKDGIKTSKSAEISEFSKLIHYDTFYKYFQKCGEGEKDIGNAQACIFSRIQELIEQNYQ